VVAGLVEVFISGRGSVKAIIAVMNRAKANPIRHRKQILIQKYSDALAIPLTIARMLA
jgi:hypothetical protein